MTNGYDCYHNALAERINGILRYDCYHNALAERINGILRGEFLLRRPRDLAQARQMLAESVEIYNAERPHLSLGARTPDAVHRASLAA